MNKAKFFKNSSIFIILLTSLLVIDSLWAMSDQEKFIQGEWEGREQKAERSDPEKPIFGISVDWKFDHGKFVFIGYPPLNQKGKYRVIKETNTSITLEFYDQKGDWGNKNTQKTFTIDKANDQLKEQFTMNRIEP